MIEFEGEASGHRRQEVDGCPISRRVRLLTSAATIEEN